VVKEEEVREGTLEEGGITGILDVDVTAEIKDVPEGTEGGAL